MSPRIVTRPMLHWPGELLTPGKRKDTPFTATWGQTQAMLMKEAQHLRAPEVVIQLALDESDIRLDGWPYANAKTRHPGVIVSVESKDQGPLSFPCDRFSDWSGRGYLGGWQANVRAVALAMEALRKVDRYGITRNGEQYVGWKALGSGVPMGPGEEPKMTADEAARFLIAAADADGEYSETNLLTIPRYVSDCYRMASKVHHPDKGGDPDRFRRLTEARDLLLAR